MQDGGHGSRKPLRSNNQPNQSALIMDDGRTKQYTQGGTSRMAVASSAEVSYLPRMSEATVGTDVGEK